MKITIDEPSTTFQQTIIENAETDELDVIRTILEILDLQFDYYHVHKYYAKDIKELELFKEIRKE